MAPDLQLECLRDLRRELRSSFPGVREARLLRILDDYGLDEFPDAFMVPGRVADRSPTGARATLSRIANPSAIERAPHHPFFSSEFYEAVNPDVVAAGISSWLHYQVHGRSEGRSPHPLIDMVFLSTLLSRIQPDEVVDAYITRPELWKLDSSPYVDCQRFLLSGRWDGETHPLKQMITHHLGGPWVHSRLMLVDASSDSKRQARLTGVSVLLTMRDPGSRFSEVTIWQPVQDDRPPPQSVLYTVVPGFFLGADRHEITSAPRAVLSPDASMIRLSSEFVGLTSGETTTAAALVYCTAALTRQELASLLHPARTVTAIAPHSVAQQAALTRLTRHHKNVRILDSGVQTRVKAESVHVIGGSIGREPAVKWEWNDEVDPRTVAIVLDGRHRSRSASDESIRSMLESGASLCVIDSLDIDGWLPVLESREVVIVDPPLLELVQGFVATDSLWELPGAEVESRR